MFDAAHLEETLIGSLVLRQDAFFELPPGFTATAFSGAVARRVFEAIGRLAKAKRSPDVPLVIAEAALTDGEARWFRGAVAVHGTTNSVAPHASKVLDRQRRAALKNVCDAAAESLSSDRDTAEIVGALTAKLLDLDASERPETVSFREAALETLNVLEQNKLATGGVLRTGFPSIDALVKIRKGNLVVLAARPGVGKSTLALNVAENVALAGKPVLFHSLEMDDVELIGRVLSRASKIYAEKFFDDRPFAPFEWERAAKAMGDRADKNLPLHLNTGHHSLGAICRITEKMHRKHGLALVVVDYLQLVEAELGKSANEEQRIGTVSRSLKLLAQRLQVPVLAVAQLNREVEKRKPDDGKAAGARLSDLRGSGRIEQDANTVLFLGNPFAESTDDRQRRHGPFDLTVAKQRLGRTGRVTLHADLAVAEFTEPKTDRQTGDFREVDSD